ncbi:MAG: hypothetical protein ABEJ56_00090 [Candidatus Nanohaloarchaea archaeon]
MSYGKKHSRLQTYGDDLYLEQGFPDDEIVMIREVSELLECERDRIQEKIAGDTE